LEDLLCGERGAEEQEIGEGNDGGIRGIKDK